LKTCNKIRTIFTLNLHEFLHTMYICVLNSVVKISMMFAKYKPLYLGGPFFRGHAVVEGKGWAKEENR